MERLIKPSDYAKELGISRQAVYAKIKKGILSSKEVDGKLYIIAGEEINQKEILKENHSLSLEAHSLNTNYEELLKAKDETIGVLKNTISDLKESNKEISTTLRGEIDLLKEAFYEMRTLYAKQLEHHSLDDAGDIEAIEIEHLADEVPTKDVSHKWVSIKKFCKYYDIKSKKIDKYHKIFKKLYQKDDTRVIFSKDKYKVDILQDFSDILK
jgi:hypothetical protein